MPPRQTSIVAFPILALAGLSACSIATRPERPAVMAQTVLTMPPEQLRLRTIEQAADIAGDVELAADEILAQTADPAIRRNALLWKANMLPAIQTSAVQFDPLVSLLDLQALCIQADDLFRTGAGRDAFGPYQDRALQATGRSIRSIRALGMAISDDSVVNDRGTAIAVDWAREHPIESLAFARQTMTTRAAEYVTGNDASAFASVGMMDRSLTGLDTRLGLLMAYLPKQIRWEVQLLTEDLLGGAKIDTALANFGSLTRSVERMTAVAESLPSLVYSERRAILDAVTAERIAVLRAITTERTAALETVADELTRLLLTIHEERMGALQDAEGILVRAVEQSETTVNAAIDHLIWRVAQLLAALLLVMAVAIAAVVLTLRRRGVALHTA
ncbi:MAG: hypothetical protein AMS20_07915 [Gemmatimonas sp. SG8_28]|jgi:hypothetical protein|nr:MAG: hypothetical protein AMS20_07915 [Gemmatimonas sp. SG8_28]